jgi:uncharacterized protein (DUF1499 family)
MKDDDLLAPHAPRRYSRLATIALAAATLAVLLVILAGPGTRAGLWHFSTGFSMMRWGAYLALPAAVLALASVVMPRRARGGVVPAVIALGLAAGAFAFPYRMLGIARRLPPIHDISTDTRNPPALVSTVPLREKDGATNAYAYEGDSVARMQRAAYPDVEPVMLAMTADSAYGQAYAAAREMGWEIVAAERAEGRIEATATTPWWGFRDDVVIRVAPASGIARVDVRSVSRVGRGDVGANAARIREYVQLLKTPE